jgi:hypothetical protein
MKRPQTNRWSKAAMAIGVVAATGGAGCATTPTPLAAAVGGEDASHACQGVPAKERELGLMSYRDAIGGTAPLVERKVVGKAVMVPQEIGVQIAVRAQPGLTAPWLERVAACHAALAASGQLEARDAKDDPLAVPGVSVTVEEGRTGFIVSVRAPNVTAAADVNSRAIAMAGSPKSTTAQAE